MLRSFRVFVVKEFAHVNKENTLDRMGKSINLNPGGNIVSFESSIYPKLTVGIV